MVISWLCLSSEGKMLVVSVMVFVIMWLFGVVRVIGLDLLLLIVWMMLCL